MLWIRTAAGEETLDLAEFEGRVLAGEIPPETPVRFPVITGDRFVPARELEMFRGLYRPDRIYFTRYFNLSRFPWITTAVVAANVAVYVAMVVTMHAEVGQGDVTGWMVRFGAKATPLIRDLGQSWRFLTANFVHKDLLHIGFNLFVLFNIGGALENAFGRWTTWQSSSPRRWGPPWCRSWAPTPSAPDRAASSSAASGARWPLASSTGTSSPRGTGASSAAR